MPRGRKKGDGLGIRWVGGVWLNPDGTLHHNKDGSIPKAPFARAGREEVPPTLKAAMNHLGMKGDPVRAVPQGPPAAGSPEIPKGRPSTLSGLSRDEAKALILMLGQVKDALYRVSNELHLNNRLLEKERGPAYPAAVKKPT